MSLMNFVSSLIDQGVEGYGAYKAGAQVGVEDKRRAAMLAAEQERLRRAEELAVRAQQAREAEAQERAEDRRRQRENAERERTEIEVNGTRFPNTPEGRAQALKWRRDYESAGWRPREPRAGGGSVAGTRARAGSYNYWQDRVADIVAANGGDADAAINEAYRTDRPETRGAIQSGELPRDLFRAAAERFRRGTRAARVEQDDPIEKAATTAVIERYGAPQTPAQQIALRRILAGATRAEIVDELRARRAPYTVINDVGAYLNKTAAAPDLETELLK